MTFEKLNCMAFLIGRDLGLLKFSRGMCGFGNFRPLILRTYLRSCLGLVLLYGSLPLKSTNDFGPSRHLSRFDGDLGAALSSITCKAIVMPGETDLYFPPEDNEIEVSMMPNAELRVIPSIYGHGAGGPGFSTPEDEKFVDQALLELLET